MNSCRRLKVLYLSNKKDRYGGEIVLERLITDNIYADHVVMSPEGDFSKWLRKKKVKTVIENKLVKLNRREDKFYVFKFLFRFPWIVIKLFRTIYTEKIELIAANCMGTSIYAVVCGQLSRKKLVYIHHAPVVVPGTADAFYACFLSIFVTQIIAVSKTVGDALKRSGVSDKKVTVIHNGISTRRYDPLRCEKGYLRTRYHISNDTILIGLIGAISRFKGFHIALEAVEILRYMGLEKKHFICFFIGGIFENSKIDAEYQYNLERNIGLKGLRKHIFLTGRIDDMLPVYRDLDVVLNCSVMPEPFGTTIIEGMAMEKVVIATDSGGASEIIDDGVDGFLVPPDDPPALAEILKKIISDYTSYEHIQKKARKKITDKFNIEAMVVRYNALFSRYT